MPRATTERSAAERSSTGLPRRRVVAARRTERALEVTRHPDPPSTGPHPGGIPVRGLAELGILGLGMLTTAALARKIRSSRRSTECMRRPGERAAEGDPHTASAAAALDPLADTTLLDWVDGANRLLTRALRDRRGALPEVRLVRAGPDGVELLLDAPVVDPPEGFLSRDGGWTWVLDPDIALADLLALVDGFRRHVPALVPIGDSAEASYLAAVGPRRHLLLRSADGAPLRPHLDAMVTALCTLPWASALQVELLGVDPPPGSRCDHTVAPSSASELVALARSPLPDAADRAVRSEPQHVLVVLDGPPADALGPDLRAAIGERAGIVTTSVRGGPEIAVTVVVEHGALVVLPDGVELLARSPTALQAALADDLLDRPLLVRPAAPAPGVASTGRPSRRAGPGQVEICVLAPVPSLTGLASPLASKDRSRVVELVAYLALAGHGATTDAIREQVFGRSDRVASLGRVHNVASAARSALGTDEEGRFLLPASSGGRYRLDERVTCDWTRFEQMSTRARTSSVPEAIELLAGALDLVGGLPCSESPSGWDWLVSRGLLTTMVSSVVDASHHLASLAIAGRELDLASWAVSKGRIVEPCSEMLARDAMILADLSGDPDALRREWHDLEAGLAILDGGEPSEETRALYEELAGSRRATSPRRRSARNG